MNALASECSSGCESGWTLYLDHSFLSSNPQERGGSPFLQNDGANDYSDLQGRTLQHYDQQDQREQEEEEEEDLSMVSDASSGPPHFREDDDCSNDDNGCFYPTFLPAAAPKMPKNCERRRRCRKVILPTDPSLLDDTASSPAFNFSKSSVGATHSAASIGSMLDYSHGFSATHFEEKSAFQDQFGFLQPSFTANQFQQN